MINVLWECLLAIYIYIYKMKRESTFKSADKKISYASWSLSARGGERQNFFFFE